MKSLKDLVPSLEICKELKEAGFEQDTYYSWGINDSLTSEVVYSYSTLMDYPRVKEICAAPMLGEIEIDELFSDWKIEKYLDKSSKKYYYRVSSDFKVSYEIEHRIFHSEIELRACMWLYLNKKQ